MRPDRKKEFSESVSSSKKFGRAERKAQLRQQLLEAARDVFSRRIHGSEPRRFWTIDHQSVIGELPPELANGFPPLADLHAGQDPVIAPEGCREEGEEQSREGIAGFPRGFQRRPLLVGAGGHVEQSDQVGQYLEKREEKKEERQIENPDGEPGAEGRGPAPSGISF